MNQLLYQDLLIHIFFFFFNDTATTEIYTLSLHDALPIFRANFTAKNAARDGALERSRTLIRHCANAIRAVHRDERSEEHTSDSSHANISYAVFCLKKKNKKRPTLVC